MHESEINTSASTDLKSFALPNDHGFDDKSSTPPNSPSSVMCETWQSGLDQSQRENLIALTERRQRQRRMFDACAEEPFGLTDHEMSLASEMYRGIAESELAAAVIKYQDGQVEPRARSDMERRRLLRTVPDLRTEYEWIYRPLASRILEDYDVDADGVLSTSERLRAETDLRDRASLAGQTMMLDRNGDGQIDEGELAEFLDRIAARNSAADLNGDGIVDAADLAIALQLAGR